MFGIMCRQCLLTQTDKHVGNYVPLTVRETYMVFGSVIITV